MRGSTKTGLLVTTAVMGFAWLLAAQAQAQTQVAAISPASQAVDEVVVTSRKTSERIEDVPLSIRVFNPNELAERGLMGLKDISQLTPGFVFQEYASTFDSSPTIRGLSQFDISSSIANVSTEVDGVYIPRNYSVDLDIGDISQIEIVKGPQSALYGSNAFAGVISYSLAKPTAAPHADISLTGGTAGRFDGKIDVNTGELLNNTVAARAYYASSDYSGTWKNQLPTPSGDEQSLGGHENRTYGADLKFTPNSKIEADISYFHLDRQEDVKPTYAIISSDSGVTLNCGVFVCGQLSANPGSYQNATSTRPPGLIEPLQPGFHSSTDFFTAQFKVALTESINATYIFGHDKSFATEVTATADNPANGRAIPFAAFFGEAPFIPEALTSDQKEGGASELNSHEVRFDYSANHLKALVGFYYASIDDRYEFNIWQAPDGAAIQGAPFQPFNFTAFPFPLLAHNETTDTTAEFGRLSYGFLDDRFIVGAEVRHSSDKLNYSDLLAKVGQSTTFDTTTPRFTLDYKLATHSLLYFSAAEGVKDGGFNGVEDGTVPILASQQTFQPETNWTYEFGSKNSFLGGRAVINADVFLVKWKQLQIQEQPSNTPAAFAASTSVITTNVGAATSYGLESDGDFRPIDHLDLNYALSLIDPTFDKGTISQRFFGYCNGTVCPANDSVGGNTLPRTSKVQLAGGATWSDTILDRYKWNAHGDFTYQSQQEVEEMNLAQIPSRLLFNASVGIKSGNWDLTIWGKNIFNKTYAADSLFILAGTVTYNVSLGEKATGGATLNYHF